jgi:hypothetical protein
MKQINLLHTLLIILSVIVLNSCSVVEGIFQAGMGFGIFIVVAIIAIIVYFLMRAGRNRS